MRRLVIVAFACIAFVACSSLIPGTTGPACSVNAAGGCSCTTGGMINSFQCDEFTIANTTCCATTGWPTSGTCDCNPAPLPACTRRTDGGCTCFVGNTPDAGETSVASCEPNFAVGGSCCSSSTGRCTCEGPCAGGTTQVNSCGTTPVPNCGTNVHLTSCN